MKRIHFVLACLLTCWLMTAFCLAQNAKSSPALGQSKADSPSSTSQTPSASQPSNSPDQSVDPDQTKDDKDKQSAQSGTSNDRLFFTLPNFLTLENAGKVPPLTAGQKFKVVARSSFDYVQYPWYGLLAGISQAEDSEAGYGQGAEGYGKRYGAYFADGTIENFMVGAVFPSILRQDPRYFQSGQGSFFHRTGYSVSRIFVTRTDSGHNQFNYSEILGSGLASAISTFSYHPHPGYHPIPNQNVPYIPSDRTLKNAASVWGSQVGYDTLTLVVKEFWPDIRRKLKKTQQH